MIGNKLIFDTGEPDKRSLTHKLDTTCPTIFVRLFLWSHHNWMPILTYLELWDRWYNAFVYASWWLGTWLHDLDCETEPKYKENMPTTPKNTTLSRDRTQDLLDSRLNLMSLLFKNSLWYELTLYALYREHHTLLAVGRVPLQGCCPSAVNEDHECSAGKH